MSKNNKPQWLLDAEKAIQEFHETEFGKLTDKELRFKQKQSHAASFSGRKAVITGQFASIKTKQHQIKAGIKGGTKLVESGKVWVNLDKAKKTSHSLIRCSHCNLEGNLVNIKRHHNDNCKQKPEVMIPILKSLPEVFMKGDLIKKLKEHDLETQGQRILCNSYWIVQWKKKGSYWLYKKGPGYCKNLNNI